MCRHCGHSCRPAIFEVEKRRTRKSDAERPKLQESIRADWMAGAHKSKNESYYGDHLHAARRLSMTRRDGVPRSAKDN